MEFLFFIIFFISVICLIVGLIKPHLVLGFLKGDKTRKKVILVFGTLSIMFFILCGLSAESPVPFEGYESKKDVSKISPEPEKEQETNKPKEYESSKIKTKVYAASIGEVAKTKLLQLTSWSDGAISIKVPVAWDIYTGGQCATKSILARDPYSELKQVFYFSEAGPVYASQQRRQIDWQNYNMIPGSYRLPYLDSPLVEPLTAENFLKNFGTLANMPFFQKAFPQVPIMTDVKIVNKEEIANKPAYATDGKLIRAEFEQNGKLGEGYFYIITVKDAIGLGYGAMFIGITAPKGLLDLITPSLKKSLESYTINQQYINNCIQAQNKAVAGILKAGRILIESSDTIMNVWENKLKSEERMSAKQSDATLGLSRLYNPNTDEVYEVTPEFYDFYQVHKGEFEMSDLEQLPDDKWEEVPLNGAEHIY